MQYDQFVGQVQHRAHVASRGEAVAAIRATLETLSERLAGGEAKDLASQLPAEIGMYLRSRKSECTKLSLPEFYQRVSIRENVDPRKAIHHARSVMAVVQEAVSRGEMDDVRARLPAEFSSLFDLASEQPEQPKVETSAPAEQEEMENPVLSTAPGYHPGGHRTQKAA